MNRLSGVHSCDSSAFPFASVALTAILAAVLLSTTGCAQPTIWQSGFESGFPGGEWLAYDNGAFSPAGKTPEGRKSAWAIVHRDSGEPVFSGNHAYKGWIAGSDSDSHRAYPVIHADIPTPLVNTFMVYVDVDYGRMSSRDWVHFGSWGNFDQVAGTGKWALHTMALRDRKLEFAHTSPFHGEYIGPAPQPEFPLRRWVRFTVYLDYASLGGFVQVWQDGVPMLRARIPGTALKPGEHLRTAHWGMYASGGLGHGVQYNDDIRICTLAGPLADLEREPECRFARPAPAARSGP